MLADGGVGEGHGGGAGWYTHARHGDPHLVNNNNSGFYLSFSHPHIAQLTNIIEYLDK